MNYTKLKHFKFSGILHYLNDFKNIPWIFYDLETSGISPTETISEKGWINKPSQITQISASAFIPPKYGKHLDEEVDWFGDWKPANLAGIYYKKDYSDMISDDNEFNEKCFLLNNTYSQMTLEKLVANYILLIDCNTELESSLLQRNLNSIFLNIEYQLTNGSLSLKAREVLLKNKDEFQKINNLYFQEKIDKKELIASLSKMSSVILSDSTSSILKMTNYYDDNYPLKNEEELLIDFCSYIEDIRESCNCNQVLLIGQNNSKFDHKFLNKRMNKYLIKRKHYREFDILGVTKYHLHPIITKEIWRTECNKLYKNLYVTRLKVKNNYLSAKLGNLANAFEIPLTNWHNAIYDVRATKSVFIEMMKFIIHLKRNGA